MSLTGRKHGNHASASGSGCGGGGQRNIEGTEPRGREMTNLKGKHSVIQRKQVSGRGSTPLGHCCDFKFKLSRSSNQHTFRVHLMLCLPKSSGCFQILSAGGIELEILASASLILGAILIAHRSPVHPLDASSSEARGCGHFGSRIGLRTENENENEKGQQRGVLSPFGKCRGGKYVL